MKLQRNALDRVCFIAVAWAAVASASCAKVAGGGAAVDNGGVTTAEPPAAASPPSSVANVATQKPLMPAGTNPDPAPAPQVETAATPPSPAVLQAVNDAQGKLDALTAVLDGTRVRFVDCAGASGCTARLEAQSLTALRDLLQSVSAQQGGIGYVAREQLDAYAGRTFVADVSLGAATPRAVPTDETELLGN